MTNATSALVLALPDDAIDDIVDKVLEAGTTSVQLLVPEGVSALQTLGSIEQLRQVSEAATIDLVLISSDAATLDAAHMGGLATLKVQGAQVQLPPQPARSKRPPPVPVTPLDDDEFLRELERLYAVPPRAEPSVPTPPADVRPLAPAAAERPPAPAAHERPLAPEPIAADSVDDDVFAAIDELSGTFNEEPHRRPMRAPAQDDGAAALDNWSSPAAPAAPVRTIPARPVPSTRPLAPQRTAPPPRSAPLAPSRSARPSIATTPAPSTRRLRPIDDEDDDDDEEYGSRTNWLPIVLLGLIALLAGVGAVIYLTNQATVSVTLPVPETAVTPFEQLAVPLTDPNQPSDTAVAAAQISSDVTFSANGTVNETTQAPASSASGVILIQSLNAQPLSFPAGTEFVAIKADGQEVRFVADVPIEVPPASTSDQGAQIVTTRGQAQVTISARAPGSASNIEANTIRTMIVPGQPAFDVTGGNLTVRHDAIGGGSEQQIRIVTEPAVQAALQEALNGLDARAKQVLSEQLNAQGNLLLDVSTIVPTSQDLSNLRGVEYSVTPAIGQPVDEANPTFTVAVQARYSALAYPQNNPISTQLQTVIGNVLIANGLMSSDGCQAPIDILPRWDGSRLTVDGRVAPNPRCATNTLDTAAQQRIKDAVRGKSRAEAEAALQALVAQNVIASYRLPPNITSLPGWDNQITVQVGGT
jgi:hypothetical protein